MFRRIGFKASLTLGLLHVEVEPGRAVFEMTPAEWHYNALGVDGGILTTLADNALAPPSTANSPPEPATPRRASTSPSHAGSPSAPAVSAA
ncbi:PaaI family thioesterase [Streptomyces sp. NPDC002092]